MISLQNIVSMGVFPLCEGRGWGGERRGSFVCWGCSFSLNFSLSPRFRSAKETRWYYITRAIFSFNDATCHGINTFIRSFIMVAHAGHFRFLCCIIKSEHVLQTHTCRQGRFSTERGRSQQTTHVALFVVLPSFGCCCKASACQRASSCLYSFSCLI